MDTDRFKQLIADVRQRLGAQLVEDGDDGVLELFGIQITIGRDLFVPGALLVVADLGEVAPSQRRAAYALMAENNLDHGGIVYGMLGLNAETGHAIHSFYYPPGDQLTAECFAKSLRAVVDQGVQWRDRVLNPPDDELSRLLLAKSVGERAELNIQIFSQPPFSRR